MQITGTLIKSLKLETGTGQKGIWKKKQYILETKDQYPKKICITAFGKSIPHMDINMNSEVTLTVDIESREYNERWYTDIKVWKVEGKLQPTVDQENEDENLPF